MANYIDVNIEEAAFALENYETVYLSSQPRATSRTIEVMYRYRCFKNMADTYTIEFEGRVVAEYKRAKKCLQVANSRKYADGLFFLIEE